MQLIVVFEANLYRRNLEAVAALRQSRRPPISSKSRSGCSSKTVSHPTHIVQVSKKLQLNVSLAGPSISSKSQSSCSSTSVSQPIHKVAISNSCSSTSVSQPIHIVAISKQLQLNVYLTANSYRRNLEAVAAPRQSRSPSISSQSQTAAALRQSRIHIVAISAAEALSQSRSPVILSPYRSSSSTSVSFSF